MMKEVSKVEAVPRVAMTAPERGVPTEVASGVYLLQMPMPFRLDHINLYLLDDPAGWTVVDCGLNTSDTIAVWERLFGTFFKDKPLVRIVVTHLHPDHLGLAQWLHRKTGAPVCMTAGEWAMAQDAFMLPVSEPLRIRSHYERLGLEGDGLEAMAAQAGSYRKLVKELPADVEYLRDGDELTVGGRRWQVQVGRGHSPECACLWDETGGMLIAGDHVLPSISPNVNLLSFGPQDPLDDYLTSLAEFARFPCTLLLPAHGLPITRYGERVTELLEHHQQTLNQLESLCAEPRTAAECIEFLFGPGLPDHQLYFAVGEAAAHLVYLARKGRLSIQGDARWMFLKP